MAADLAAQGRPRRVVLRSADFAQRVVDAVRQSDASLADALAEHLRANARLLREDELPVAPVDPALAARVARLEAAAAELAARVRATRARVAPRLAAEAADACAKVTAAAGEKARAAAAAAASRGDAAVREVEAAAAAVGRARRVGVVAGRVAKLRSAAGRTRARAGNVLEALRIIAENDGNDENNTVTISMDGKALTLALGHGGEAVGCADGGEDVAMASPVAAVAALSADGVDTTTPPSGRRRSARVSLLADPAASPHITPRSKTRRRLLGSPGGALRCRLPR